MAKVTEEWLRQVQERGWQVDSATQDACIATCPARGCQARVKVAPGGPLPMRKPRGDDLDNVLSDYRKEILPVLIARRKSLALSIAELEDILGVTPDQVSKYECKTRSPSIHMFISWAASLGLGLVLVPCVLPTQTARAIEDTRHIEASRVKRFKRQKAPAQKGGRRVTALEKLRPLPR